ncbi:MAG: ankyrin repeat domain-containing protein [Proteobacteria bacterium]|nr:ankyrin repeat domain-containing protein [Pseudomonadota bacterium]
MNRIPVPSPNKATAPIAGRTTVLLWSMMGFLLFLCGAPALSAPEPTVDQAFEMMTQKPDEAERQLRQSHSPRAKLYLAMLLHLEGAKTPERDSEIRTLLSDAIEIIKKDPEQERRFPMMGFPAPYDGTFENVVQHLLFHSYTYLGRYKFPCATVEKHPFILTAISNWNNDRNPRLSHGCTDASISNLSSVQQFWTLVDGVTFRARAKCSQGSILRDYAAGLRALKDWVYFSPHLIQDKYPDLATQIDEHGLRGWATTSRWNWELYRRMEQQFEIARRDLAIHYRNLLGVPKNESVELAGRALLARIFGVKGASYKGSLADRVLSGAPMENLREGLISAAKNDSSGIPPSDFTGNDEPLLMIAVTRPEVVALLLEHGANPDITNDFGKTPLMAAAQYDDLRSVNALIADGAKVNGKSFHPTKVPGNDIFKPKNQRCNAFNIKYGERTALMYAAANAKRAVIEALLKAGADPTMVDSEGNSANDYLSGRGPTPVNPKLTDEERNSVADLLKQFVTTEQKAADQRRELNRKLLAAAAEGSVHTLRQLIDQGADLKTHDSHGKSALHLAVKSGKAAAVEFLLSKGMDPNLKQGEAASPLATAITAGHTEVVRRLIAAGADVHSMQNSNYGIQTPMLQFAAQSEKYHPDALVALIDAGAAKDLNEAQISSLFDQAMRRGSIAVFERLIRDGFAIHDKPEILRRAVSFASGRLANDDHLKIIRMAIAAGIGVNARVEAQTGKRALHMAQRPEVVSTLLSLGADLEATDYEDLTPLATAIGKPLLFHALLGAGASTNTVVGHRGWSELHAAAAGPNAQIENVRRLLESGHAIDIRDETESTPLMWAYEPEVIRLLLERGADINAKTKTGDTVLNITAQLKPDQIKRFETFVRLGADPNISDNKGLATLALAARAGIPAHLDTLLAAGAEIDAMDQKGLTALHHAAMAGSANSIGLLLSRGIKANLADKPDWTPLRFAVWSNHRKRRDETTGIQELLAAGANLGPERASSEKFLKSMGRYGEPNEVTMQLLKTAEAGKPVFGKAFNCQPEAGYTERAICGEATLERVHRRMSELYDARRRALRGEALRAAIGEHRTWLRRRTAECRQPKFNPDTIVSEITPCLLAITTSRLRELEKTQAK